MRRACIVVIAALAAGQISVVPVCAQTGGSYDLRWNTIDGGGTSSTAAPYGLGATIGQPDAGRQRGGDYGVTGGFWGGIVSSAGPVPCVGDCNHDGAVTVTDLLTMVNIALDNAPVSDCPAGDGNEDGQIAVNDIVAAVTSVLSNCHSSSFEL